MKATISWLNAAIAGKELSAGMTYYKVNDDTISATNGKLTACAPWLYGGKFFVPGDAFEKILKRMPSEPTIEVLEDKVKLKCGRFSGTIQTLPLTEWSYPGVANAAWQPLPSNLPTLLAALRPFVSENEQPAWGRCIALDNGWAYATNNMTIAGAKCEGLDPSIKALLPAEMIDFLLGRLDGLESWVGDDNFIAFRWANGAWCRTQLVIGQFPEKAAAMVKGAWAVKPTQPVTDEFKEALSRIAELAEDTVNIHATKMEAKFDKGVVEDGIECEVPAGEVSIWGARTLLPALQAAAAWSPAVWPAPAPFKGPVVAGYIVGRRM